MQIFLARWLFPVNPNELIEDALIVVENGLFLAAGKRKDLLGFCPSKSEKIDLGDCLILPGLVNAHTHLELSGLSSLAYPGSFTDWIKSVLQKKTEISDLKSKEALKDAIQSLIKTGTTTVGDHAGITADLETLLQSPLKGRIFLELIGVSAENAKGSIQIAQRLKKTLSPLLKNSSFSMHPSPHSAHALNPFFLKKILKNKEEPLFSIHLSESAEEAELFTQKTGKLFEFISERSVDSNDRPFFDFLPALSAFDFLEKQSLLSDRILSVHANGLSDDDLDRLTRFKLNIVHCPRSHAYFGHPDFPFEKLIKRGLNIALGTDSLASNQSLSLFDEIRFARKRFPHFSASDWIRIASYGGAKALKLDDRLGSIRTGLSADWITIPIHLEKEVLEEALETQQVASVTIQGKKVL